MKAGNPVLRIILVGFLFSVLVAYFLLSGIGNDVASPPETSDSLKIHVIAKRYAKARYVDMDFMDVSALVDPSWLSDNKALLLTMQKHILDNPQLTAATKRTKVSPAAIKYSADTTLFETEVTELDFGSLSNIVLDQVDKQKFDSEEQKASKVIETFIFIAQNNDTIPTVTTMERYYVLRRGCEFKVFPISN